MNWLALALAVIGIVGAAYAAVCLVVRGANCRFDHDSVQLEADESEQ